MSEPYLTHSDLKKTGFGYTLSLIGGKYKMITLYAIYLNDEPIRYNTLKRKIGDVSFKTLTNTLKELEADGLVARKEYPEIPPKVEYSLTKEGKSLIPIMDELCEWGTERLTRDGVEDRIYL
jgi:DNA-binding HxlR family transcriptional regulator